MTCKVKDKERQFKECGSFRWEITDKYGDFLPLSEVRDNTINDVLNEESMEVIYTIGLKRDDRVERGWGLYNVMFTPKYHELKLYSLGDGDNKVRVNLKCKTLQECESLINMLCEGNSMKVMPAYLK